MSTLVKEGKALSLLEPRRVAYTSYTVKEQLDSREVLIKMRSASVCETDIKIYEGEIKTAKLPIVLGHEGVGEVVRVGPMVSNISVGDLVLIDPNVYDSTCEFCRRGKQNLCPNGGLLGRDYDGLFREYLILPEHNVFKLPRNIDLKIAPLIQPLSTIIHAQKMIDVSPGDIVAVIGTGTAGLIHVQLAKARGARVIGVERDPFRMKMAKEVGADDVVFSDERAKDEIMRITDGQGVDAVIEAVGLPETFSLGWSIVKPGRPVLMFGISPKPLPIPGYDLYFKEIRVIGTRSSVASDFLDAIRMVSEGKVRFEPLVTSTVKFDEALDVFETIKREKTRMIRTMIMF
ncbi:MAG: alcohol dehydrogenase catalytic domain-containing protein [Candidatus Nezhaarchaeales archaeon]